MFIEFASPLITINELNVNVVDLAWSENDRGYLRIASTLSEEVSADVTFIFVLFNSSKFGIFPVSFNFFSNTSDITGNLRVFPEFEQAFNVTAFVLRMMQLVLFACAASLSSQSWDSSLTLESIRWMADRLLFLWAIALLEMDPELLYVDCLWLPLMLLLGLWLKLLLLLLVQYWSLLFWFVEKLFLYSNLTFCDRLK